MFSLKRNSIIIINIILVISITAVGCGISADNRSTGNLLIESAKHYQWAQVTDHAAFPGSYNFPLFNIRNKLWVFHSEGNWYSEDGKNWTKSDLPRLGLNTGYQQYVQFNDAIYALGTM